MTDLERYRDWEGGIDEIIALASTFEPLGEALTVSNFRYYQKSGVVGRGDRRSGNQAVFGERELLELVLARRLVRERWPLAKVAEHLGGLTVERLRELALEPEPQIVNDCDMDVVEVPQDRPTPDAAALVSHFMSAAPTLKAHASSSLLGQIGALDASTRYAGNRKTKAAFTRPVAYHGTTDAFSSTPAERTGALFGPGGWLTMVFDPQHPSLDALTERDALRQIDTARQGLEERVRAHFSTKSRGT